MANDASSQVAAMSLTQPMLLPPLDLDAGGLHVTLFPPTEDGDAASNLSKEKSRRISTRISLNPSAISDQRSSVLLDFIQLDPDDGEHGHGQPDDGKQPAEDGIPTHPIPVMQAAFAESLHEVTVSGTVNKPKLRELDAKGRRERLLDQAQDESPFDAQWRYRPGQQQHEVVKLLAQISFGVYLLLKGMANSNSQVVAILQGHIDEVDEFLEVALEDLAQAAKDLNGRIDYLKLPMTNMKVFEELLADRNFRAEILEGNQKIEHIVARTNVAAKQWDDDIDAGSNCALAFSVWLKTMDGGSWVTKRPELTSIYEAMNGNAEGWLSAFDEISKQAQEVKGLVIKLTNILTEMEQKAGEISRKTWANIQPFTSPPRSIASRHSSHRSSPSSRSKPKSITRASVRSGSVHASRSDFRSVILETEDDFEDFPLPGSTPLLPPRWPPGTPGESSRRGTPRGSVSAPVPVEEPASSPAAAAETNDGNDGALYLLQPRTYTPQPSPVSSPVVQDKPTLELQPGLELASDRFSPLEQQDSLRHRVSRRVKPPQAIRIPPRNVAEAQRQSSGSGASRLTPVTSTSLAYDSAYGSGLGSPRMPRLVRAGSHSDLTAASRPPLIPGPHSDHQFYRPVRASPHSPLQQRPHTAAGPSASAAAAAARQQSGYFPHHEKQPSTSRPGGHSSLSTMTMAMAADSASTMRAQGRAETRTQAGDKQLKKKKSAFGWFKKAFSMDEEEKAAYEARKAMTYDNQYYNGKTPKYLDGKKLR